MATLRIEHFAINAGTAGRPRDPLGGINLAVTGTATSGGARPTVPSSPYPGGVQVILTAEDASVYVDLGPDADAGANATMLILQGRSINVVASVGDKISAVLASDVAVSVQPVSNVNGLTVTQTAATVTSTSGIKLAANAARRYLAIANIGTNRVSLNFGSTAVADQGWPLSPAVAAGAQGGSFIMEGSGVSTQAIHAISPAATTLIILEG